MRNFRPAKGRAPSYAAFLCCCVSSTCVYGQVDAKGFAVERLNLTSPGTAFVVMDDLHLDGNLGAALAATGGYARHPLGIYRGAEGERLYVVDNQAFAALSLAVLYDRFRFTLNFNNPIYVKGKSGTVGRRNYVAPNLDIGKYPDVISDVRLGFDVRLWGAPRSPLRLGLSSQLFVPSGKRRLYITDGTYRAMLRALFAGNAAWFSYAGFLGVHIRALHESSASFGPQGSELLFGLAAGPEFGFGAAQTDTVGFGPELFGASALGTFLGARTTGIEAMLSARYEHREQNGKSMRVKLGIGEGLKRDFGAPDYRCVIGVELLSRVQ